MTLNPKSQSSGKGTLSIENLGREKILRVKESRKILNKVDVKSGWFVLSDDGNNGFTRALNDFVCRFLAKQMRINFDAMQRKKFLRMRVQLEAYNESARSLKLYTFPPPYLPRLWYDQAIKFFDDVEANFEKRSSGGRTETIAEWEFIGQCAALFTVSFGIEPTSTTPGVRPETGSFTKFLWAIEAECRARLINPGTAAFLLPKHFHAQIFLASHSEDQVRKRIDKALAYKKPLSEDQKPGAEPQLYWVGYKKFIEDRYIKNPN